MGRPRQPSAEALVDCLETAVCADRLPRGALGCSGALQSVIKTETGEVQGKLREKRQGRMEPRDLASGGWSDRTGRPHCPPRCQAPTGELLRLLKK